MSVSNGIITAPVSIEDVCTALGITYNSSNSDLKTLCKHVNINVWSRFKPTIGGSIPNRKTNSKSNSHEKYSVLYGLAYYDNQGSLTGKTNIAPLITDSNFNSPIKWSFGIDWNTNQSSQNFYRLQDFNGYNHNTVIPLGNYQFLPSTTIGEQTGPFFNNSSTIFRFTSLKSSSYSGVPLPSYDSNGIEMCWEDATSGSNVQFHSQLFLEDLFKSAEIDYLSNFNLGTMYFGVLFKIDSNYILVNSLITFNTILFNNTAKTYQLIAYEHNGTTKYVIGSISYGVGNLLISLNIQTIAQNVEGFSLFRNVSRKLIYVRSVLTTDTYRYLPSGVYPSSTELLCGIRSGTSVPTNLYSLQIDTSFGNGSAYFNKLLTFVSVTSYTDRNNNTARNAGKWFDSTENGSGTDSVDYTYTNGNWVQKNVGHPPRVIYTHCSLRAEKNKRYKRVNGTGGSFSYVESSDSDAVYVRYAISLRGYICCEFRLKNSQSLESNYYLVSDSNVEKETKIKMKFPSGVISILVGNTYRDVTTDGIPVGSALPSFYWNNVNKIDGNGYFRYCDMSYGSSSTAINRCHSEMIKLNYFPDFNESTSYSTNNVFLYVLKTSVQYPSSLHISFEYSFGPDIDNDYETITISDQSGNTYIYDSSGNDYWSN